LRNISLDRLTQQTALGFLLIAYLDTLGWVEFAEGNLPTKLRNMFLPRGDSASTAKSAITLDNLREAGQ